MILHRVSTVPYLQPYFPPDRRYSPPVYQQKGYIPFAMVPILSMVMGAGAKPILARVNAFLDRVSGFLMPALLGLIGVALLADAIKYFVSGTSLF